MVPSALPEMSQPSLSTVPSLVQEREKPPEYDPDLPIEIHIINVDGTVDARIDSAKDATQYLGNWSPDGRYIHYREVDSIFIYDTQTGEHQDATSNVSSPGVGGWSPNSANIAFSNLDNTIIIYNLENDSERIIDVAPYNPGHIQWNLNGSIIAFESFQHVQGELLVQVIPPLVTL